MTKVSSSSKAMVAGEHFVEHGAEAVDVGAGIAAFALDLLGRHVMGRAGGESTKVSRRPSHAGDAEIHNADGAVVADHDVLRLEIAMDDIVVVHVLHGLADQAHDREGVGFGKNLKQLSRW